MAVFQISPYFLKQPLTPLTHDHHIKSPSDKNQRPSPKVRGRDDLHRQLFSIQKTKNEKFQLPKKDSKH